MGSIFKESKMITNTELQNHFDITDDAKHILTVKLGTMLEKQDTLDERMGDLYNMVFRLHN